MRSALLAFVALVLGVALAAAAVANPFGWTWLEPVRARLTGVTEHVHEPAEPQRWTCSMHPQVVQDAPGNCPICQMPLVPLREPATAPATAPEERRIRYWRAPMDPTYISDEPGKSPMGMDLIPVYEDEVATLPGVVHVDPGFVQRFGVQTVPVERTDIPITIRTVATLRYDDRRIASITMKYDGWLEKVHVAYVGEPVAAGQPLFEIYSPQLVTTQQEYLQALEYAARMRESPYPEIAARAAALVDAGRRRLAFWDVGDDQVEALAASGVVQRTLTVRSPVGGVVIDKMDQALEGTFAKAGATLYRIANLSTIWADAEVFEHQAPWLRLGQRATLELPYESGRTHTGRVRFIQPSLNETTRSLKVSLEIPNPRGSLRADMYANVAFEVPGARGVLAVPDEAVLRTGTRNLVVLDRGNGLFQVREIALGAGGHGLWEVTDGVHEGDRVVVSAQFLLDSESRLREAIRALGAGDPATEPPPLER